MNGEADINKAWRIDTLDSRGGLAFASYRAPDLSDTGSADGPAAFISAPDFRPESVSSRAVGLAAGRGASQIGLFLDDAEVGFGTLAAVVEFVRRCYLRGAGGDGTDSGGAGLPVTPGEGPRPDLPEQPDLPSEDSATDVRTLLDEIGQFEEDSKKLQYYTDKPTPTVSSPWNRKEGTSSHEDMKTAKDGIEVLLRAALTLIFEMLRRYPVRGSDDDIVQWHSSAQLLGSAFSRLGLWPFFLEGRYAGLLSMLTAEIDRLSPQFREQDLAELCADARAIRPDYGSIVLLPFLFGGSWFFEGPYLFETWHWYPYDMIRKLRRLGRTVVASETDPIDDLSRWPIPKRLSHLTGKRNLETANVLGLMTTIQGSPSVIAVEDSSKARSALEIALFGAAHVVGTTEPEILLGPNAFPAGPSPTYFDPARLHELRVRAMVERVQAWFVEQMPQIVFPQRLERVIQETAEKSYND